MTNQHKNVLLNHVIMSMEIVNFTELSSSAINCHAVYDSYQAYLLLN